MITVALRPGRRRRHLAVRPRGLARLARFVLSLHVARENPRWRTTALTFLGTAFRQFPWQTDARTGQPVTPAKLSSLLSTPTSTPLNFTTFVTLLASHLSPLDPEADLVTAFASFDETESGFVRVEDLKEALASGRDGLTEEEVRRASRCPPLPPHWEHTTRMAD